MDNLTHTLFAATLAHTRLDRLGRGTTAALLLASNAPDIDIVAAAAGGGVGYLHWHRGPTHGPLGIVGLGVITAALVCGGRSAIDRGCGRAPADGNATFLGLTLVSMLGVLLHILMDFPTSYGTRLLSPFDWHWYTTDLMPILDIYLMAVLVATLAFARRTPEARRRNAAIALVFMAANYGARAALHRQALTIAPRVFAAAMPPLCDPRAAALAPFASWPREWRTTPPPDAQGRCLVEIAAMPDFVSPFRWRLVARFSGMYEVQDLNLLEPPGDRPEALWRTVRRVPDQWTPEVLHAADAAVPRVFLDFSRFPAARTYAESSGGVTVRWTDLRFGDGVPRRGQDPRTGGLFSAVVLLGPDGEVLEQRLGQ